MLEVSQALSIDRAEIFRSNNNKKISLSEGLIGCSETKKYLKRKRASRTVMVSRPGFGHFLIEGARYKHISINSGYSSPWEST